MHFFTRNMARLRKETFQDKFGKTIKVLDSTERVMVLLQYLNHANSDHLSFPGSVKLSEETGLDRRNVRDSRDDLVRAGWLTPAGSVNYQGVQSEALPGAAKKGRKSGTKAYRVTLPGMSDDLALLSGVSPGVTGGVLGGVLGGVTVTPQTKTETKTPTPADFPKTSVRRVQTKGGCKEENGAAADLANRVLALDLGNYPAGAGLRKQKLAALLPICEKVAGLPNAATSRQTAERVALSVLKGTQPGKYDLQYLFPDGVPTSEVQGLWRQYYPSTDSWSEFWKKHQLQKAADTLSPEDRELYERTAPRAG